MIMAQLLRECDTVLAFMESVVARWDYNAFICSATIYRVTIVLQDISWVVNTHSKQKIPFSHEVDIVLVGE